MRQRILRLFEKSTPFQLLWFSHLWVKNFRNGRGALVRRYRNAEHQLRPNSLFLHCHFRIKILQRLLHSPPSLQRHGTPCHQHFWKESRLMQRKPPWKLPATSCWKPDSYGPFLAGVKISRIILLLLSIRMNRIGRDRPFIDRTNYSERGTWAERMSIRLPENRLSLF